MKHRKLSLLVILLLLTFSLVKITKVNSATSNTVYRYDLSLADWETKIFVSTFEGIINRDGPNLYILDLKDYVHPHPTAHLGDRWNPNRSVFLNQGAKPLSTR